MSREDKSCVFVRNKSIIKTFLTSTSFFPAIDFSAEKSCLQAKIFQNKNVGGFCVRGQQGIDFFIDVKCYYELWTRGKGFWIIVIFWRHPFTAEDPLVSKWCNATFLQNCSHDEINSSTSWMSWGWVHFSLSFLYLIFFFFWLTIFL